MTNKEIFEKGKNYLLSFPAVTEEMLTQQLTFPEQNRPKARTDLFKKMLEHAKNRQGMPNAIGDIELLARSLWDFDPDRVLQEYQNWESLFDNIKQHCSPPGRMVKSNRHNYWVIFCKSILSIAKYISRFGSIEEFDKYVGQFITETPDTRLGLPLILKEEIFGYQFALACDFIKDNISPDFVKPDVHIKDIFIGIGKSLEGSTDYQIFRDVIDFARSIEQTPYAVDKLFWLIGSGDFYLNNVKVPTKKKKFIESILTH
jgi:hypothetical protein